MALIKCKECGTEVSSKADACPKCGVKLKHKTGCFTILLALILIPVALAVVGSALSPRSTSTSAARSTASDSPRQPSPRELKEAIRDQIKLDWEWQNGGFGNVMEADFKITNGSDHDIKDIEIRTTQSGKSGTQIDRNTRTIYEIIKARQTKVFKKFNMGFIHSQSESASARITDFVVIQ